VKAVLRRPESSSRDFLEPVQACAAAAVLRWASGSRPGRLRLLMVAPGLKYLAGDLPAVPAAVIEAIERQALLAASS